MNGIRKRSIGKIVLAQAFAVAVATCACWPAGAQDGVRAATSQEVAAIRKSLERQLNDAQSARFDSVKIKGEYVCGLINAKNGFGAYAGYRPFQGMVFKAEKELVALILGVDAAPEVAMKMCAEKGIQLPPV